MNKKLLVCIMVMICQHLCFSQIEKGFANREEIKEKCQQIVDDFSQNKASGFHEIGNMWVFTRDAYKDRWWKTVDHLETLEDEFGASIGNKLVKEDLIEDVIYQVAYVLKYEKNGILVQFIFYNGKDDKWYLNDFNWGRGMEELFKK